MTRRPSQLDDLSDADGILAMRDAIAAGASRDAVHSAVRTGRIVRPFRGTYLDPHSTDDLDLLRAAVAHVGTEARVILRSATRLHGLAGDRPGGAPQLALPPGLEKRQRRGLDLHFWDIPPQDLTTLGGLTVTNVERTLADVCRLLPRMEAVSFVDSALYLGLVDVDELSAVRALMHRKPGCVRGRARLAEARTGAQSPLETRVRLRSSDGGFPPDALQVPVYSPSGVLLGYGDCGYALPGGAWLIVEADGRGVHELPEALLHDRRRQNSFVGVPGVFVVRFTWPDTTTAPYVPGVLRPILERAGWRPRRS